MHIKNHYISSQQWRTIKEGTISGRDNLFIGARLSSKRDRIIISVYSMFYCFDSHISLLGNFLTDSNLCTKKLLNISIGCMFIYFKSDPAEPPVGTLNKPPPNRTTLRTKLQYPTTKSVSSGMMSHIFNIILSINL